MKIVGIQAIPLSAPLAVPIGRSQSYSYTAKSTAPAKVVTDGGVFGIGNALTPIRKGRSLCHSGGSQNPGDEIHGRAVMDSFVRP